MAKRGASGLSFMIAIDKPKGMTSHDVVNRVRRIFNEKRVGHTGTLDPLASGVLCIAVGPATRLDAFLSAHDKTYVMDVAFGVSTNTDDAEGAILDQGIVPDKLFDESFARVTVADLVGAGTQVPPRFSAIKVKGQRSYHAARKGEALDLQPRDFEVFSASLDSVYQAKLKDLHPGQNGQDQKDCPLEDEDRLLPVWRVTMRVSGGTYMRSIARDLGQRFGCGAFVAELRRVAIGVLSEKECVSLDELSQDSQKASIDPLRLLSVRFVCVDDPQVVKQIDNGNPLNLKALSFDAISSSCDCAHLFTTAQLDGDSIPCFDGEVIALLVDNRIKALYSFDAAKACFVPRCVFSVGVERGFDL